MKKIIFKILIFFFLCITNSQRVVAQTTVQSWKTWGNHEWTVPCGVSSITVEIWGAGGAGKAGSTGSGGGGGGYVKGVYAVTPGQIIYLMVGGGGNARGEINYTSSGTLPGSGFGGGGPAGTTASNGASGGGASGIFTSSDRNFSSIIAMAGGGGGGGATNGNASGGGGGGGGAGSDGNNPLAGLTGGGKGGTTSAGGNGGANGNTGASGVAFTNPTTQAGGNGANGNTSPGGGGGGGYYGGGGGSGTNNSFSSSGGGGGSGYFGSLTQTIGANGGISTGTVMKSAGKPGDVEGGITSPNRGNDLFGYAITQGGNSNSRSPSGAIFFTYVVPQYTVSAPSSTPTLCINSLLTNITHTTTVATGIANNGESGANGLPTGVSASWTNNTIIISGTPTSAGTFDYSIPLTGEFCSSANATGRIIVTPSKTTGNASSSPTLCINALLTNITHTVSSVTGISNNNVSGANGLPAGVKAVYTTNLVTISGTPTVTGTFNYTITLIGCGVENVYATGTIIVISKTVSVASSSSTFCINTPLTAITHTTSNATGISNNGVAGANGLPAGVSASWASDMITISGTPTASGTFSYSIPLTGGCGPTINATGTIVVNLNKTVGVASSSPTLNINTPLTAITHNATNASGVSDNGVSGANGLPAGVTANFASNLITISGTPTVAGTFNYTIPLTGCGPMANATGTIISRGVPILSNFPALTKNFYDRSFTLNPPTSDSPGAFTYQSSNTSVATISGRTITFLSQGTTTITANQDQTPFYQSAAISFPLTVNGVVVTTRSGAITSTDLNYASRSGALTGKKGKKRSGQIMVASTSAEIQTLTITNASSTTATATGSVISQGESTITARGFCWNTATNPTIENSTTSETGTTGALTSTITGLSSGTTYYFRAYTTNSSGTSYGNEISFTKP